MVDVYDALVEFCVQQSNGAVPIEKINEVVCSAFSVFSKFPRKHMASREIMNYAILDEGRNVDDILYDEARENAVICDNGVILGTFMIKDGSYIKSKAISLICGYDVVYDTDNDEIMLVYVVHALAADGTMTMYRVPTDVMEDFDLCGFVVSVVTQMCRNLI
ncbi:MAG: hypothetical protein IJ784_01095 [Ruminiclostridium sp.]|nr:hypothetical protein [Ruminiclostridium sp.]